MNIMRTTFLMVLMTGLMMGVGQAIGGRHGMEMALIFAGVMNFFSYWFSDKLVLRMYNAQEVGEAQAPELYSIVRNLATAGQIPMPKLYMIPTDSLNAFATGRNPNHAAVAVTAGIMRILDRNELSGVIGHELSHVRHRDILISSIAATMAGAIGYLAHIAQWGMMFGGMRGSDDNRRGTNPIALLAMIILAPLAALLIQMAVSRSREYDADLAGAKLCGNPMYLASALRKLERGAEMIPMEAQPSTAHMFIINPLSVGGFSALFRTHPNTEDRIARLEAMARGAI